MDDNNDGFWVALFLIAAVALLAWTLGDYQGHVQGVKDHAAGRYVVVKMPDGTEQVCEVKEPK